jgi:hypothetical protein
MACPPSARLEEKLKDRLGESTSPFAAEGTKAHALAELKLLREKGRLGDADGINEFCYTKRRETLGEIDEEMDQSTDCYVDIILEKFMAARRQTPDAKLLVEQRLDFSKWVPHGFGTGDAVIVADTALEVCDLKYGKGVRVEAENNPQARCYGLGAYMTYGDLYDFQIVRTTIIQPRLDHVSEETLDVEHLLHWADTILAPAAALAWEGKGEFHSGEHCKFCMARAICFARAQEAMKVLSQGMEKPGVIPEEEIPRILEVADAAMDWFKELKQYALSQAIKGHRWYGFKLVRGKKPARAWKDEDAVTDQLLRAGIPREDWEVRKLKSVSQVQKMVGKQAFDAIFAELTTQGEGAYTLVPESDGRPEVSPADATFADLIENE